MVCPLLIDPASVETREWPEPDIRCNVANVGSIAFELVEAIDEDFAASDARALRGDGTAGGSYSERDPLLRNVGRKLHKTYRSDAAHMELLAYVTRHPADPRQSTWQALESLVKRYLPQSAFDRVWVFDDQRQEVVFAHPEPVEG